MRNRVRASAGRVGGRGPAASAATSLGLLPACLCCSKFPQGPHQLRGLSGDRWVSVGPLHVDPVNPALEHVDPVSTGFSCRQCRGDSVQTSSGACARLGTGLQLRRCVKCDDSSLSSWADRSPCAEECASKVAPTGHLGGQVADAVLVRSCSIFEQNASTAVDQAAPRLHCRQDELDPSVARIRRLLTLPVLGARGHAE
jgi:hypothetical protein